MDSQTWRKNQWLPGGGEGRGWSRSLERYRLQCLHQMDDGDLLPTEQKTLLTTRHLNGKDLRKNIHLCMYS